MEIEQEKMIGADKVETDAARAEGEEEDRRGRGRGARRGRGRGIERLDDFAAPFWIGVTLRISYVLIRNG